MPRYDPGAFWDEMFEAPGIVRPHYQTLARRLATLSSADVARRQRAAELSFTVRGITFAVNQGAEGVEKIMPFDLIPRIIQADEWTRIERGLEQRVRALNLFLHDIYHDQRILRSGVIPPELVLGARGYRREFRQVDVPLGVYTHIVGSDLVRDGTGELMVLEDNLRTPSGVSYVVENRRVLKRTWPQIFQDYDVRPVEGYPQDSARRAPRHRAADGRGSGGRAAHAGRVQLGVLRARLPREGDGRRARAGLRSFRRRRAGVHAHDGRAQARGRDLSSRGR